MTCPGRGICTTIEALTGHGRVTIMRDGDRWRVEWVVSEDDRFDGHGDTIYDALEAAVARWSEAETRG